jgi:hypothetical protein
MRFVILAITVAATVTSSAAEAGVLTDDLARCMVEKSSDADKTQLARWMFAAMSKDPSLANMANITQVDRDRLNKGTADLFSRLMLVDCRKQAVAALKNEGTDAFGEAGKVLGAAAAQKLMSSPEGQGELGKLSDYMDEKAWTALANEAGVTLKDK